MRMLARLAVAGLVLAAGSRLAFSGIAAPLGAVGSGQRTFVDLVTLSAAAGAGLLLVWVGLVLAVAVLSALPGAVGHVAGRLGSLIASAGVRQAARLALGLTVAVAPATITPLTATAQTASPVIDAGQLPTVGRPQLTPPAQARPDHAALIELARSLPPIGRPQVGSPSYGGEPASASGHPAGGRRSALSQPSPAIPAEPVTVGRGDTLWEIAARSLGEQATVAEIAREWPRWYSTNRAVIGPDPDLIRPGMLLHPPDSPAEPSAR